MVDRVKLHGWLLNGLVDRADHGVLGADVGADTANCMEHLLLQEAHRVQVRLRQNFLAVTFLSAGKWNRRAILAQNVNVRL